MLPLAGNKKITEEMKKVLVEGNTRFGGVVNYKDFFEELGKYASEETEEAEEQNDVKSNGEDMMKMDEFQNDDYGNEDFEQSEEKSPNKVEHKKQANNK